MEIVNRPGSAADLAKQLRDLDDGELVAQELVQKGAIHALEFLQRNGCTPAMLAAMLESARSSAATISAECRRRGMPTVVDPSAH